MRRAVIDTSVAVKWFFPEKGKDKALKLRTDHANKKISLCTRDLFLYELTSAFKNYSSPVIANKDFLVVQKALETLNLAIFPLKYNELSELFTFAQKLNISIYDCSFLLLAKKLGAPFYTADKKLYLTAKKAVKIFFIY